MNAVIEPSKTVIHCENLSVRDSSRSILSGISLDIPRGAVVGVVGRNGAGKSTLLRSMVGLTAPERGCVTLFDRAALEMNDDIRARLGYAAQTPDLFEWLTAFEHLELIGKAYPGWDSGYCLDLALRFDLPLRSKVSRLSGGDKQKLSVVLAMAHKPEVLVLDEPVSNLDPLTRRDFMRALFSDSAGHTTVVISSHLLNDLERLVSHVLFMREGAMQFFDTWDAILEHVRMVPTDTAVPPQALVRRNRSQQIIDTRRAPVLHNAGHACSLDQLFDALNT